ncbi:Glycosyltransferase involved in cell wall bisynthesis [Tistlia consotensis]|uniref:Glycosyltransferase involved in cell wall bisynthesis n=1 Tax=Tistlia consotensis USBA 355 TaxID=560819 RepID=A0A1Y6CLX4_9PROT|nr:glycosyltransferase family 4 protein [Tistlia consotensis]SMF58774.1 Glycosyltransferase involved in cell wall bisynthesis [Tistlia consotensis USBA 355]SNR63930.1 Glycosyltransferase involved in cell wall bisynthesis [Tistlia consotensis]
MSLSDSPFETRWPVPPPPDAAPASGAETIRLAMTSVFGDPLLPLTWSGAPNNLARALGALGAEVTSVNPRLPRGQALWHAWRHVLLSRSLPLRREVLLRDPVARRARALAVTEEAKRLGLDRILHTGTLDLPGNAGDGIDHYLYCDHTWDLAMQVRSGEGHRETREYRRFEELEHQAYDQASHIFTFGRYVRDNLIGHYGVAPERVTAVGSGFGQIRPYTGLKDYARGPLVFVAKHLFAEKGGNLAVKAFRIARRQRPNLRLIIAGHDRWRDLVGDEPGVHVVGRLSWDALEELMHSASLLLQPMLNDPWGQVYLEALISRTPVAGLERNGLPEITGGGRYGFLVPQPDPVMLAETLLDAVSDPDRLAGMGAAGQRHVVANYSWPRAAEAIASVLRAERP